MRIIKLLYRTLAIILIFLIPSILHANNLPRSLQGIFLEAKVSKLPILLGCDERFLKKQKNIITNINKMNIYMCVKSFNETILLLTETNSDKIVGILQYSSIISNIFTKFDNKEEVSKLRNKIQEKYGNGKTKKFLNVQNTTLWDDGQTILFVNNFNILGLFEKKYLNFFDNNLDFDELHKYMFGDLFEQIKSKPKKPITVREINIIQNHIKKCWKLPSYYLRKKQLIALKVKLNQNMIVSGVDIIDKQKYFKNASYRAAADSARRAVLDCSKIPLDKSFYPSLKEFEIEFDTSFLSSSN